MNAKQFLRRAYKLNVRIDSKLEQLEHWKSLAFKITSVLKADFVDNGSRPKSTMENAVVKIVVAENELNDAIERFINIKKDINETLDLMDNENERILLELRYLCFNSWEEIAVKMNICVSYTFELHKNALKSLNKILESKGYIYE
jgi:DNA-directed RNA polymerase specialized sigma subunit